MTCAAIWERGGIVVEAVNIILPVKALDQGKSRLGAVLPPQLRQCLCRDLFRTTLDLARSLPGARPLVVSRDPDVLETAGSVGAEALTETGLGGLNEALGQAQARLAASPLPCLVLPCDLVLATGARLASWLAGRRVSTLVPDAAGLGTNLLWLAPGTLPRFTFAYGPGSCAAHRRIARRRGVRLAVETLDWAGQDLDLPEDLELSGVAARMTCGVRAPAGGTVARQPPLHRRSVPNDRPLHTAG